MVKSPYKWKILEWDVKAQTNKQSKELSNVLKVEIHVLQYGIKYWIRKETERTIFAFILFEIVFKKHHKF